MITKQSNYIVVLSVFSLIYFCSIPSAQAQSKTENNAKTKTELIFAKKLEKQTREQLKKLLSEYDLDPWIYSQVVEIDVSSIGRSYPVITLSTSHNDLSILREFIHQEIHHFLGTRPSWKAAIKDLRQRYPDVPTDKPEGGPTAHVTYLHLIVNWLEFDAMTQLLGEEKARQFESKVGHYTWVYDQVLEDTQEIGAILTDHNLLITPKKGLIVKSKGY